MAARGEFARAGYDGATLRAIAREAEVDQALLHHYYGTKEQLFVAAVGFPALPSELVAHVLAAERAHMGEMLLRLLLQIWDTPENRAQVTAILRSALTNEPAMTMLRQFMTATVLVAVARGLDIPDGNYRAALVFSQIVGLGLGRYVFRIPPLADADHAEIVAAVGPTLQRYLTGAIGTQSIVATPPVTM